MRTIWLTSTFMLGNDRSCIRYNHVSHCLCCARLGCVWIFHRSSTDFWIIDIDATNILRKSLGASDEDDVLRELNNEKYRKVWYKCSISQNTNSFLQLLQTTCDNAEKAEKKLLGFLEDIESIRRHSLDASSGGYSYVVLQKRIDDLEWNLKYLARPLERWVATTIVWRLPPILMKCRAELTVDWLVKLQISVLANWLHEFRCPCWIIALSLVSWSFLFSCCQRISVYSGNYPRCVESYCRKFHVPEGAPKDHWSECNRRDSRERHWYAFHLYPTIIIIEFEFQLAQWVTLVVPARWYAFCQLVTTFVHPNFLHGPVTT